jgi:hypothetical protein
MTGALHHAQLLVDMGLANFLPGLPLNGDYSTLSLQGARIKGVSHQGLATLCIFLQEVLLMTTF